MNGYDAAVKAAGVKLDAREKKQITAAVSWKNPDAEKMIKKVHKKGAANPIYGIFNVNGKLIEVSDRPAIFGIMRMYRWIHHDL